MLELSWRFLRFWASGVVRMGFGQAIRFIWSLFWAKRSILEPRRSKFDVFGPDRTLADVADMARRDPTSPDGRLDGPVLVYD